MSKNEQRILLTTDTHLNHSMLVSYGLRPEGYDERVLNELKQFSKPGDVFIHLGDVCIGDDHNQHQRLLTRVSGAKSRILVRGNHDRKSDSWYYSMGWNLVVEELTMKRYGLTILLSHVPINFRRRQGYTVPATVVNLHGHTHGNGHRSVDVSHYYDPAHIELALENNNYRPWILNDKLVS